jgi:hypothetical protein
MRRLLQAFQVKIAVYAVIIYGRTAAQIYRVLLPRKPKGQKRQNFAGSFVKRFHRRVFHW